MDSLDLKILAALQEDARRRNIVLAQELGVAPSTALERVRRLEAQGCFRGFNAVLVPERLGFNIQAMVTVALGKHTTEAILPFEQRVREVSFIRACYHVTGRFDYLLHVVAVDLDHLGRLVKEDIAALPGVGRTETHIVFSEIKPDKGLPVEEASINPPDS
jgi:Lrp/AsnC family leucine-responsive transcriptional regulator